MEGENSTGINLIWAITMIIVVAIIAGTIYVVSTNGNKKEIKDIDVEIKVPSVSNSK